MVALESTDESGVAVLTVFAIMLIIGIASYHILAKTRLPYTAILIMWGAFLGVADSTYQKNWKLIGEGTMLWQAIQPSLLLAGFLPILLFAAAFGLEWHHMRRLFGSAVLLAGPGILFSASLTAVLVKYTFPYKWTWVECLLFGAIFSATDPVAVVAVLKETGMSKKVRTLVDLEALLNDGTAYVLFKLLQAWAEGQHQTVSDSFRIFFRLTAGGPATGVAFGIGITLLLRTMYNKPLAEISLTIAGAYATYIVADQLFNVSAVLAVVFLGLWMAATGFNYISRSVEHSLHLIWEELEFIANTVVFILAGIVIAGRIYESSSGPEEYIHPSDWGYTLLLWVYLTVIRIVMLVLAWPLLNWWGYVISPQEAVVLSWSGLRGAVGISLALYILLDDQISDLRYRTLTFFHMGCVAFLTIVLQGTTMKPLLQWLKLTRPPKVKTQWFDYVLSQVEEHGEERLRVAKHDRVLGEPDWKLVQTLADLGPPSKRHGQQSSHMSDHNMSQSSIGPSGRRRQGGTKTQKMRLAEKRRRFLLAVRQTYLDFFQDHYLSSRHIFPLCVSTDKALDQTDKPLHDWELLKKARTMSLQARLAARWLKSDGFSGRQAVKMVMQSVENAALVALAFCNSYQLAAQDMTRYEKIEGWDDLQYEEMASDTRRDLLLVKRGITQQVLSESQIRIEEALGYIADVREAWPECLKGIKTTQLAQEMLMYKEDYIKEIAQTGLIEETELEQMLSLVELRLRKLHFNSDSRRTPSLMGSLPHHYLFAGLNKGEQIQKIISNAEIRLCDEGDKLSPKSSSDSSQILILLRGKARLVATTSKASQEYCNAVLETRYIEGERGSHVSGAVLGLWELLSNTPCPFSAVATTPCLVVQFRVSLMRAFLQGNEEMSCRAYQLLGVLLALLTDSGKIGKDQYHPLMQELRSANLLHCEAGEDYHPVRRTLLLAGEGRQAVSARAEGGEQKNLLYFKGPCRLPANGATFTCLTCCKVLCWSELNTDVTPSKSVQANSDTSGTNTTGRGSVLPQEDGNAWPEDAEWAAELSEATLSLASNRRKSLAHGLHLQGVGSPPAIASRMSRKPEEQPDADPAASRSGMAAQAAKSVIRPGEDSNADAGSPPPPPLDALFRNVGKSRRSLEMAPQRSKIERLSILQHSWEDPAEVGGDKEARS